MDKEPITIKGLEKIKEELVFLKEKKRPEIVAAISEARSHGDLKENAEYHAAKEQQSHNEGRIQEIENTLARANVIDVTKLNNEGKIIGELRSACYSPHFKKVIGIAMIKEPYCKASSSGTIEIDGNSLALKVCDLPFI